MKNPDHKYSSFVVLKLQMSDSKLTKISLLSYTSPVCKQYQLHPNNSNKIITKKFMTSCSKTNIHYTVSANNNHCTENDYKRKER